VRGPARCRATDAGSKMPVRERMHGGPVGVLDVGVLLLDVNRPRPERGCLRLLAVRVKARHLSLQRASA